MSRHWRLGVVGQPVAHSLSPRLHEAGLALAGLEGSSTAWEVGPDGVDEVVAAMGPRFDALSVTMPLKELLCRRCAVLSPAAATVGAVNSVRTSEEGLSGAATDGSGLLASLAWRFGFGARGARVALLGAGGAAAGIVGALVAAGAGEVAVLGRTPSRVERLVSLGEAVHAGPPRGEVDLVVNTVPVSGRGEPEVLEGAGPTTLAVDIAYEPRRTPWREAYARRGCAGANGLDMLAFQAAEQMRWWWGVEVDGAALVEVIE